LVDERGDIGKPTIAVHLAAGLAHRSKMNKPIHKFALLVNSFFD
jgi:cellulose biosynthesis protein BcsQ